MGYKHSIRNRDLNAEQKASGLTIRAFCRREGIHEKTFYNHRKRSAEQKSQTHLGAGSFVKLRFPAAAGSPVGYEILRGDTTLRLPNDFNLEQVRALMALFPS